MAGWICEVSEVMLAQLGMTDLVCQDHFGSVQQRMERTAKIPCTTRKESGTLNGDLPSCGLTKVKNPGGLPDFSWVSPAHLFSAFFLPL